jgi:hypothetical protein
MWSVFKDNKFVVGKLVEGRKCCDGYEEIVIVTSSTKILIPVFMK